MQKESKIEIKGVLTMQELIHLLMGRRGLKSKDLAEKLGVSAPRVSQVLEKSSEAWIETVKGYFNAMDEDFKIVSGSGKKVNLPDTVITMGQLRRKYKQVFIQVKNGDVYEIVKSVSDA